MSKRKLPDDFMGSFLSGKPAPAGSAAAAAVDHAPADQGDQARVNFWLPTSWKTALTAHFKAQGLDLSSGIRQALAAYMREAGLR
jgi:hypothetical protein